MQYSQIIKLKTVKARDRARSIHCNCTCVTGLSGGRVGAAGQGETVPIVSDTHFKLHLTVLFSDHVARTKFGEQVVLVSSQIGL